jgi:isochorismate synthase
VDSAACRVTHEIGARVSEEALVVLTVPAPLLDTARLLAIADGPIVAWSSPEPEPDGRAFSLLGWGEAARIDATGPARIAEVRARAARLFDTIRERRCSVQGGRVELSALEPPLSGARLLSPRLFGGLSFRPRPVRGAPRRSIDTDIDPGAPPWPAFHDASFVLPRWLYGRSGRAAFLRLAVPRDQEGDATERLAAMRARLEDLAARADAAPSPSERAEIISDGDAPSTTPEAWRAMVLDALARIRAGELEKVVGATLRRVTLAAPIDVAAMLRRLDVAYPDCARFAFQRGRATFLGASPERLVTVRGLCVEADALAGSARRGGPQGDAAAARALLESGKDRREHALVVSAVASALRPRCRALHVPEAPVVRSLRNVHHLHTPIEGDLARPAHVLELVELLHPTPAVSGSPRDAAAAWIASREAAPRGWYAGAVGWFDESGDGSFAVAIRSGLVEGEKAWIYTGAGLVEGSDPDAELAETRVKQAPFLAALGLSP